MPIDADEALRRAVQHQQAGRWTEAEKIAREVIQAHPNHDGAIHYLGMIAWRWKHHDSAIGLFRRAIAINPAVAGYHNNLGSVLFEQGRYEEALGAFRKAIEIDHGFALAYYNAGEALMALNRAETVEEAIRMTREAIRLNPRHAEARHNLGIALRKQGRLDEAMAACREALAINPKYASAYNSMGNILRDKGDLQGCIGMYERAIGCDGNFDLAHYNIGMVSLLRGDFEVGWEKCEWRLKGKAAPPRDLPAKRWNGEELEGKRIMLWGEQGMGDVMQFVRYVPLVAKRGGRTVVKCYPELIRLLRGNRQLGEIAAMDAAIEACDVECPIMSLPMVFKTRLESIPAQVPYLIPEGQLVEEWKHRLGPPGGRLRVGLVWAGNPGFKDDRPRSMTLEQLARLGSVEGVAFYGLQKGKAAEQAKNPPAGLELVDLGPELNDFAETAAVMSQMDLIISTDTSVPHLAGAMGRPVWVMLQYSADFRWLLDREDSPWYPTMRLFRQKSPGDWEGVVSRVAAALAELRARGSA